MSAILDEAERDERSALPPRPRYAPPAGGAVAAPRAGAALPRLVGVAWPSSVVAVAVLRPMLDDAVTELTLPLRHEDMIRQQAREKHLDPALIAARHLRRVEVPRPDLGRRAPRA